jgi:hypothetical protein
MMYATERTALLRHDIRSLEREANSKRIALANAHSELAAAELAKQVAECPKAMFIPQMVTRKENGKPERELTMLLVFDPLFPCLRCGLPVFYGSCGGTAICGECDCGGCRPATSPEEIDRLAEERRRRAARGEKLPNAYANVTEWIDCETPEDVRTNVIALRARGIVGCYSDPREQ